MNGITRQHRDAIIRACAGQCPVCKKPFTRVREEQACVDLCHLTGTVRGVLCRACAEGIALFRNDPNLLRAAARYLQKFQPRKD